MRRAKWPFLLRDGCAWPNEKNDSLTEDSIRCVWQELAYLLGSKRARGMFDHSVVGPAELRYLEVYAISKGWGRGASSVLKDQRDIRLGFAVDILLDRGVPTITKASELLARHYDQKVRPDTIRKAYNEQRRRQKGPDTIPSEPVDLSAQPLPDIHFEDKADDVKQ